MWKKSKLFKNKKIITAWAFLVFLIFYYIFFFHSKVDLTFRAADLEVRTIDNKKDFEKIIVSNIYDKIVESCKPSYDNRYKSNNNWNIVWGGMLDSASIESFEWRWWIEVWFDKGASVPSWNSLSDEILDSIDFDWSIPEEQITQSVWFSQTNIQKQEVDEWDILKQTKDYIFYFSKAKSKIFIIKSPLNWENIDLQNAESIFSINIPSNLALNPELFVNDERLVYLASKKSYNTNNTIVWIYDISDLENKNVELLKIFETKWDYFKSRLIDNNLYLISDYSLSPFKSKFCNVINNEEKSKITSFISFFTWIEFKLWVNKELYQELKEELETYSYKIKDNNLDSNWENQSLEDFKIFYTNKDLKESIENLNFNVVSVVDIEKKDSKNSQTLVFWNLKDGEIHMTLDNLYLVNSYYQKEKWKCDYIDICYKEFSSNNFTSISKISYSWKDLKYEKSSIIPWKPLNQYSMDEDEWYFRIFSASLPRNTDASLYVFDKKLKLIWKIENIKRWEEFKSARFIWDKAFLVTFRQIDPLFVIDLHIPSEPKIIWELEIPWYSSYLHPYWKIWNKEYLIWLWKQNSNVKIDLYEIDYETKWLWDMIDVKQKYSYKFNWTSSESPAEDNPRAFVWDSQDNLLYLPIDIKGKYVSNRVDCQQWEAWCNSRYYDSVTKTYKYQKYVKWYENAFIWLKVIQIDLDNWINEVESNYSLRWDIANSRVWYYKTENWKASFFVEPSNIIFFSNQEQDKPIYFE